jgi:hypothetical protein
MYTEGREKDTMAGSTGAKRGYDFRRARRSWPVIDARNDSLPSIFDVPPLGRAFLSCFRVLRADPVAYRGGAVSCTRAADGVFETMASAAIYDEVAPPEQGRRARQNLRHPATLH